MYCSPALVQSRTHQLYTVGIEHKRYICYNRSLMSASFIFERITPDKRPHMTRQGAALFLRDLYHTCSANCAPDPEDMQGQVEGQTEGRSLFVVHDRGQVVGIASASVHDKRMVIHELATDERRRREGIGRTLMAGIVKEAAEAGVELLWLRADAPAIPFYENVGLKAESPENWYIMQAEVDSLQQCLPVSSKTTA